jgi:TM2 domain-containing membrane protein YozV
MAYDLNNDPVSEPFKNNEVFASSPEGKSRGVTALLAIFSGSLGIHYFYLGKSTAGIVVLLLSVCSCGILAYLTGLLAFVQGILMFCIDNEKFREKYILNPSKFPLF